MVKVLNVLVLKGKRVNKAETKERMEQAGDSDVGRKAALAFFQGKTLEKKKEIMKSFIERFSEIVK